MMLADTIQLLPLINSFDEARFKGHLGQVARFSPLSDKDQEREQTRGRNMSSHNTKTTISLNSRERSYEPVPFQHRTVKPNPLVHKFSVEQARDTKRRAFLNRVSQERDEQRWIEHSNQLLKLEFDRERKQWEQEKGRSAPTTPEWQELEEVMQDDIFRDHTQSSDSSTVTSKVSSDGQSPKNAAVRKHAYEKSGHDLLQWKEEQDMEDLLALMDNEQDRRSLMYEDISDGYDALFSTLIEQEGAEDHAQSTQFDCMDISAG